MASLLNSSDEFLLFLITIIFTAGGFYLSTKTSFKTLIKENEYNQIQNLNQFKEIKEENKLNQSENLTQFKEIKAILTELLLYDAKMDSEKYFIKEEVKYLRDEIKSCIKRDMKFDQTLYNGN